MSNKKRIVKIILPAVLLTGILAYCFTLHTNRKLTHFWRNNVFSFSGDEKQEYIADVGTQDITGYLRYDVRVNRGSCLLQLFDDTGLLLYEVRAEEGDWLKDSYYIGELTSAYYTVVKTVSEGEDGKKDVVLDGAVVSNTYGYYKIMQWTKKFLGMLGLSDYKNREGMAIWLW